MELSDDILANPERLTELCTRLKARACFLVDESGTPFATVGYLEYPFPNPHASLSGGEDILNVLVGASKTRSSPELALKIIASRALLVIILEDPLDGTLSRQNRRSVKHASQAMNKLLDL